MLVKYKDEVIRLIIEAGFELPIANQLEFEKLGSQGWISSLFRVKLKNDSTIVVKVTEKDNDQIKSKLHNREIEFYRWLNEEEKGAEWKKDLKCPKYYGGKPCIEETGIILMEDCSSRICNDLDFLKGFKIEMILKVVKEVAAIQCAHLSSNSDLANYLTRFDYASSVRNCLPKINELEGLTAEMKSKLNEWVEPVTLLKIQTEIPLQVQGVVPTLIHCDLWNDNFLFCRNGTEIDLLAIIDWQCFKIGNPLLDIASLLGLCMNSEERREHTQDAVKFYVYEMQKREHQFNKPFHMTVEKANCLLSHASKRTCVQLMAAVVSATEEELAKNPKEYDVLSARLTAMMTDTLNGEKDIQN